jgi:hypothetical protein
MADQVKYKVVEGWEQLPKGIAHRDVAGVAVDQEDRVFLICRGENPIIVYDRQGNFLRTWGKGDFSMRTHGIYVAPNGTIFAWRTLLPNACGGRRHHRTSTDGRAG